MNVSVTCNGTSLNPYLISYTREDNICNSTSIATLSLSINCPIAFDFYNTIVITEDGIKKGTYALITKNKSIPNGIISISASNSQKSLENHFIEEKYDIQDTPTLKTRYWIEKFMTEAGVTYTITAAGAGEYLPSDLVLGGVMAIDVIKQLLQYSGWYMRYDENGVAIVGILDYDSNYYSAEIEDTDIVDFKIEENDAMLRNRVVVWGMGSTFIENNGWTFVDLSVTTPWNYDDNDKRTILISNSMISDITLANTIAKKTLDEFTKPNIVKTVKVKGFVDVMVGDRILVNSKYYNKICTVTTVYVGLEQGGTHTTLTLDERCPRLIGYFNYGGYVYVGTDGDGIWRKPLKYSDDWENYSTGITDLHITDLSIAGGTMACVTSGGHLYVRYPIDTQWNRVSSFTLYDEIDKVTYATINGEIVACSVDRNSGVIYAGIHYQLSDSGFRSWVGKITSPTNIVTTNIVTNSGNNYYLSDLDSNNYAVYINAYTPVTTSGIGITEPAGYENKYDPGFIGWDFREGGVMYDHDWFFPGFEEEPVWQYPFGWMTSVNAVGVYENDTSGSRVQKIKPIADGTHYAKGQWVVHSPDIQLSATSKLIVGVNHWQSGMQILIAWNTLPPSFSSFGISGSVDWPRHQFKSYGPDYFEIDLPPTVLGLTNPIQKMMWWSSFYWFDPANPPEYPDWNDPEMYVGLDFIGFTDATAIHEGEYPPPVPPAFESSYLINVLLEHKTADFYIVASVSANLVDASQDYPVAVYGGDVVFNSGSLEVYKPPNTFNYVNLITYSSGGIGSTAYVYDIRSFSQLVPGSGYLRRSVFTRNTVVDGKTYLQLVDYDLITIPDYIGYTIDGGWVPFSGTAKHVEVSNYGDNPYFFVSIAGSPSKFYQKDRYDNNEIPTTYEDNSYGLPSSEVTIIRLDDLI